MTTGGVEFRVKNWELAETSGPGGRAGTAARDGVRHNPYVSAAIRRPSATRCSVQASPIAPKANILLAACARIAGFRVIGLNTRKSFFGHAAPLRRWQQVFARHTELYRGRQERHRRSTAPPAALSRRRPLVRWRRRYVFHLAQPLREECC